MKASGPSRASSDDMTCAPYFCSIGNASESGRHSVSRRVAAIAFTATGPFAAIRPASSFALVMRLAVGNDVVDEPDLVGPLGGDVVARQQHLGGDGVTDLAAQPDGRSHHRKQAALHLGDPEDRALTGDAQGGALQDLGAAGPGETLGGQDDRLGRHIGLQPAAGDQRRILTRAGNPLVGRLRLPEQADLDQVHAGAEGGSHTGEDRDAQLVIRVEQPPGVGQQAHHVAVDGVALLRPVQRHDEDVTVSLDEDG